MTASNVADLNTEALTRIGNRIDAAWRRVSASKDEWVEGSLELIQALGEARGRFTANQAFGAWLVDNHHDHVSHQDRAALLGMARDLTIARDVLTRTDRRSYRHIWEEVQSRFTHVGNTPRRRARSDGSRPRRRSRVTPETSQQIAAAVLDQGMTQRQAVSAAAEQGSVQHAKIAVAYERGRREAMEQLLGAVPAQTFTDSGRLRIEDAVRVHKSRLDRAFEQKVNEEVRRRIAVADDEARRQNRELRAENTSLTIMLNQRGVFTERQYAKLMMCVHPDNSASVAVRNEIQALLSDANIRRRLIKTS